MIDPVTGMLVAGTAAQVVGGVLSYQQRKALERAQQKLAAKLRAMIDQNYKIPPADMEPLTAEEYRLVGEYNPEITQYIQETAPQLITEKTPASVEARRAQLNALRQMQSAATAQDPVARAQQAEAEARARDVEASTRAQRLQQVQATGGMRGGERIVAEMAGSAQGASDARQAMLNAAAQQRARQLQAIQQSAGMAGDIRSQERSAELTNVGIMNDFNRRTAQARQSHLNEAARLRNAAQLQNLQARQDIANKRTELRNFLAKYNKEWQAGQAASQADFANKKLAMQMGTEYTPQYSGGMGEALQSFGGPLTQVGAAGLMRKWGTESTSPQDMNQEESDELDNEVMGGMEGATNWRY